MMPASDTSSVRQGLAVLVIFTMVFGAVPAQLMLTPAEAASGEVARDDRSSGTRGLLPSDESFDSTSYRAFDSDNDTKRDAITARYTVRTTAVQEQVSVLVKALDSGGNTVKFHYDNFTAFLFGNQQRSWTFYAHYTDHYRMSLTLFDSNDRQEDTDTSGVYYLDTGTVKRWITLSTKSLDLDNDTYDDDVEVHVTNWTSKDVEGAQVWINGTYVGKTNSTGRIVGRNYPEGWINIDAFWKDLHNSTSWRSEGDGTVNRGLSVRADTYDFDGDGLEDDVEITVRNQLNLPVRNAQITINGTGYGTTDNLGQLTVYNLRRGWYVVNATKLTQFGSKRFFSEGMGAGTDLDEYFFDIDVDVVDLDGDDRENDLRMRFDVDVNPRVVTNVTVWVNITWAQNGTAYQNLSTNFTINGTQVDYHTINATNMTYGMYRIWFVLLDEDENFEDWWLMNLRMLRPSNHINVETGVYYDTFDMSMDDILFRAMRVDKDEPNVTVRLFNDTGARVRSGKTSSSGRVWFDDMADGTYNFTATDSDGRLVERGRIVIGARVQVETDLSDLDFDGFYDDFRVRAYNNVDRAINTVTVTVWAANGTRVTSNLTLGGQLDTINLTKGTYEFNATYLGEELVNGTFYSYGTKDEPFTISVRPAAADADGDGRYDDLNVTVVDVDDSPLELARVYVDGTAKGKTDINGSLLVKDLSWGLHTVRATYGGEVANATFFSEGTSAHTASWTVLFLADTENYLDNIEDRGGSTNDTVFLYYSESTDHRPKAAHLWIVLDGGSQEVDLGRLGSPVKPGQENRLDDKGVLEAVFKFAFVAFKAQGTAAIDFANPSFDGPYQYEQNLTKAASATGGRIGLLSTVVYPSITSFGYEIRSSFDYAVSYKELQGFPLATAVKSLRDTPSTTPRRLGELIIDRYSGSGKDTTALVDMSKVGPLATALDDLTKDLANAYPSEGWAIQDARNASETAVSDFSDGLVHLDAFGDELDKVLSSAGLRTKAVALRDAARAVVVKRGSSTYGMFLFLANDTEDWDLQQSLFNVSNLAADTHWDEFLEEFWRFRNFGILVNATAFDAEGSGRDNDVRIYVNDTYGRAIAGVDVYIDLTLRGQTNATGWLEAYNFTRGVHLVNVTWKAYEAEDTFSSEGTVIPNQEPSVSITSPSEGDTVNRTHTIRGTASDPDGIVNYVEVRFNGSAWARASGRSSWRYDWDTRDYADGTWKVEARAYDGDLYSDVAVVNVTVHNPVEYADVLLVDDDGGMAYDVYFTQALLAAVKEYDVVEVARNEDGPDAQRLGRAKYVIWLTGEESEGTLTSADVAALSDFLDGGGALWLTGQDVGRDLTSDGTVTSAFMRDYLRADFVADNANDFDLIGVRGEDISGGINISIEGGTGARNQNFPSEIQPRNGTEVVYLYNGTAEAAVKYADGTFRTVYFAFGFEGIARAQDRNRVLEAVLDWLAETEPTNPNEPPQVSAGNDVVTLVGEVAVLRGTASDPDGVVALFEWDFEGDGTYDWANESTGIASHVYNTTGNYTAKLRATDNFGDFATATVGVEVRPRPANQPPTADAGEDIIVYQGDPVEFVMAGHDPDGSIVLYEWDYDGDGAFDHQSPVPRVTNHTFYDPGVYQAALRVTDDEGATGTDTRQVTVEELVQNQPPTADAGPDIEAEVYEEVTLAGVGTDPDGHIAIYKWDFDGDGFYDWDSTSTGTATHVYSQVGTFNARLLVIDDDDAADTDSAQVTISPIHVNEEPVADAGPDDVVEVNQSQEVEFQGKGSDPDGFIVLYEWDFDGDGTYDWNSTQQRVATWVYDRTGLFIARLRVTDNDGATDVDTLRVSVRADFIPNEPPTAEAGGPYSGVAGEQLTLNGSGSDPEGKIASFQWDFEGDGTLDHYNPASGVTTVVYPQQGEYTAILYVTDEEGAVAQDSADVVIARANDPPEVRVTTPSPGDRLRGYQVFRGSAFDDRSVSTVYVRIDDGPWHKASGTSSWSYDVNLDDLVEGVHTLHAYAVDGDDDESQRVEVQFEVLAKRKTDKDETPGFAAPVAMLAALGAAIALASSRRRWGG